MPQNLRSSLVVMDNFILTIRNLSQTWPHVNAMQISGDPPNEEGRRRRRCPPLQFSHRDIQSTCPCIAGTNSLHSHSTTRGTIPCAQISNYNLSARHIHRTIKPCLKSTAPKPSHTRHEHGAHTGIQPTCLRLCVCHFKFKAIHSL